jgi:hypothetical protein
MLGCTKEAHKRDERFTVSVHGVSKSLIKE